MEGSVYSFVYLRRDTGGAQDPTKVGVEQYKGETGVFLDRPTPKRAFPCSLPSREQSNQGLVSRNSAPKGLLANFLLVRPLASKPTRPGFEPGQREPKSLVLPLHYRVSRLALFRGCRTVPEMLTAPVALSSPLTPGRRATGQAGRRRLRASSCRPGPPGSARRATQAPLAPGCAGVLEGTRPVRRQASNEGPPARHDSWPESPGTIRSANRCSRGRPLSMTR